MVPSIDRPEEAAPVDQRGYSVQATSRLYVMVYVRSATELDRGDAAPARRRPNYIGPLDGHLGRPASGAIAQAWQLRLCCVCRRLSPHSRRDHPEM
jgi:hypothetical protein